MQHENSTRSQLSGDSIGAKRANKKDILSKQ